MKKIQYIAPSIKVANVKLQNILAGSDPSSFGVDPSKNNGEQWSKKGSSFDSADFEDEDF